jgi:radical SAM/Cys-rich protein
VQQAGAALLTAGPVRVLQLNLGKLCNQRCHHCHVDAGPDRTEENMDLATIEACLQAVAELRPSVVDITGGAPELNPHFRLLVTRLRELSVVDIIDRCNLSVLLLASQRDLADFLAEHRVHVVASLPAVNESQTDAQRGDGVFDRSIAGLRLLNEKGYGRDGERRLTLMSNPAGAFLPPPQAAQEQRFKRLLERRYGIVFDDLIELTNMPISRFLEYLLTSGNYVSYMERLSAAFNAGTLSGLMCTDTLSVGWDGQLYDCDFNQQLELPVAPADARHISDLRSDLLEGRPVVTGRHCLGCTAGQGSSCGGATA